MKHEEAIDRENQKAMMRKGMSEKDAVIHSMKNKVTKSSSNSKTHKNSPHEVLSREEYPYGLRIHVDGDQAKKLGVHKAKAGHKVKLKAHAKVVSVSHNHRDGEEPSSRMELQITHMGMHGAEPDSMQDPDGEDQD
jgi:hypothetical protein